MLVRFRYDTAAQLLVLSQTIYCSWSVTWHVGLFEIVQGLFLIFLVYLSSGCRGSWPSCLVWREKGFAMYGHLATCKLGCCFV